MQAPYTLYTKYSTLTTTEYLDQAGEDKKSAY